MMLRSTVAASSQRPDSMSERARSSLIETRAGDGRSAARAAAKCSSARSRASSREKATARSSWAMAESVNAPCFSRGRIACTSNQGTPSMMATMRASISTIW
jgi:hypothetical protein